MAQICSVFITTKEGSDIVRSEERLIPFTRPSVPYHARPQPERPHLKLQSKQMDRLSILLEPLKSGRFLLDALRSSQLTDSILPTLVADVLCETRALKPVAEPAPPELTVNRPQEPTLSSVPQLSLVAPRGKHDLSFGQTSFTISSAKISLTVPYAAISSILILDSVPNDNKGKVYLYLSISESAGLQQGKAPLRAVVVGSTSTTQLSAKHPRDPSQQLNGFAAVVLCQMFGIMGVSPDKFVSTNAATFRSMTQQKSGIPAHVKAKSGVLFPLSNGLCFLESPALFIPRTDIKSIELARAGGNSSTFDVLVNHKNGHATEFGMLPREELGPLQNYMMIEKIKVGGGDENDGSSDENESADGEASSSDDEDFNPSSSSSEGNNATSEASSPNSSSMSAEVVSEDDMPTSALRKVMLEQEERPIKRRR